MISLKRLLAAALLCTLGMSLIGLGIFLAFDGVSADSFVRAGRFAGLTAVAGVGYGLTLWAARRNMRSDAGIGGRRDLIAGVLAVVVVFALSVLTQGAPAAARFAMVFVSGIVSALAMYFPWFQRQAATERVESAAADA